MNLRSRHLDVWLTFFLVIITFRFESHSAVAQLGYFELRLLSLNLPLVTLYHRMIPPETKKGALSPCAEDLGLAVTACLSHHQLPLPRKVECTLGHNRTTLRVPLEEDLLVLPFSFSWPGAYTLSLTAVRTCPSLPGKELFVSELMVADFITPSPQWVLIVQHRRPHPEDQQGDHPEELRIGAAFSSRSVSNDQTEKLGPNRQDPKALSRPKRAMTQGGSKVTSIDSIARRKLKSGTRRKSSHLQNLAVVSSDQAYLHGGHISPSKLFTGINHSSRIHTESTMSSDVINSSSRRVLSQSKDYNQKERLKRNRAEILSPSSKDIHRDKRVTLGERRSVDTETSLRIKRSAYVDSYEASVHLPNSTTDISEETTEGFEDESVEDDEEEMALSTEAVVRVVGTDIVVAVRVVCSKNYFGPNCSELCRPRDDLRGHWSCDEQGRRVCLPGWTGQDCTQALCSELCRSNRGICSRPGLCTCRHGWYGEHCDKCRTTPGCVHGTCHLPGQCVCHKGWAGPLCDVESRYCLEHSPCLNGGTCHHDSSHNYTCSCPRGYVGAHCEVSECHSNFCLHSGTCLIAEGTRYCLCSSHYTGPRCQHKMDNILSSHVACDTPPCSSPQRAPSCSGENCRFEVSAELVDMALTQYENHCLRHICYNGGRCSMGTNISAPTCKCPAPFGGPHCLQVTKSSCRNNPCMNGGECRAPKNMGAFQCICTPEYTGKLCQKVIQAGTTLCGGGDKNSSTKPSGVISCHNGGQCEKSPRGRNYYCKCHANFTGEFCELEKKDPCSRHQCLSGGICSVHASNGTAACICPTGYSGAVCENRQLFSACNRIQCHHGGACVDLPHNNFQCVCRGRYEGKYCERETRHGGMVIEIRTDCCNSRGESRCHSQSLLMLYLLTLSLLRLFIS